MVNTTVYFRTDQGDALLGVPYGNISGDARRLLELIDGIASVDVITHKVPLSVQVQLDEIFAQLLSENLIAEKYQVDSGAETENTTLANDEKYLKTMPVRPKSSEVGTEAKDAGSETKRRIDLENELADVRSQLAATKARQKEVESVCRSLEQQVAAYEHAKNAGSAENMQQIPAKIEAGKVLHDSLDNLNQLNQALIDQQKILDGTLKLRSFQMQLSATQSQEEIDVKEDKEVHSNPHYKKLRGLEFFKGFANAELLHFLKLAKWQNVRAGERILHEGDVGMPFFVIVSGSVKVVRKAQVLATLGRGEFFGEFAYLSEDQPLRSAQVAAASDCELLVVEPMDVEFSSVQMRLHVVEALLRGQVKRALLSSQRVDSLLSHADIPHEPH